jgi:hypothetical protein
MTKTLFLNILRFVILILIQGLVLNRILFSGYINPYIYILFILLLPFDTPKWILLVSAFFLGLCMDMFSNTPGMHAAASVLIAFLRPKWLGVIIQREDIEIRDEPGIRKLGLVRFVVYASVLVLIHHSFLFFIEVFRLDEFFSTLFRAFLSSIFTMLLMILSLYLFKKSDRKS